MKRIQTAKNVFMALIMLSIGGVILWLIFWWYVEWHGKEITNQIKQGDEISQQYEGPIVYAVLLDTDPSMQLNFPGIGDGLKDRMKLYACLLDSYDTLAIFPRNFPLGDYIVFQGSDDLKECISKIDQIECFTKENEKTIEAWVSEAADFVGHHTEKTHLEIISDKAIDEFQEAGLSFQAADETVARTSADHIISDYAGYGLSNWGVIENGKNFAAAYESSTIAYVFNQHYYASETVNGFFDLIIRFPYLPKQFVLVLSGDDMHITRVYLGSESSFDSFGFTLSNSDRVFCIKVESDFDYCEIYGNGTGSVSVVYPYPMNIDIADIVNDRSQQATIRNVSVDDTFFSIFILPMLIFVLILTITYIVLIWIEKRKRKQILMSKQVFISYRRSGATALAHAIVEKLASQGFGIFMDVENLKSGKYDVRLLNQIENSACVVLVLPADGLQRCLYDPDDWVKKEIEHAIECKVPLIPVLMNGFHFPANLPGKLKKLADYNAIWFDEQKNYEGSMVHVLEFVKQIYRQEDSLFGEDKPEDESTFFGHLRTVFLRYMRPELEDEDEDDR